MAKQNTGFTTLVNGVETDLINIFAELSVSGTKLTYNTNYVASNGKDLTDIFEPYVELDASANPTKYTTLSGGLVKDLNVIFAKAPIPFPTASNYMGENVFSVAISGKYVIAGTISSTSGIWYSSDYGKTFYKSTDVPTNISYTSVAISGSNAVASGGLNAGGTTTNLYYSSNYGVNWSKSTAGPNRLCYNAMCISGARAAACVEVTGELWVSTNFGATYSSISKSLFGNGNSRYVTMDSTNYYYVVTTTGVYRSQANFNTTASFTQLSTLGSPTITSISADLTNNVVMVSTNSNTIYYSTANGAGFSSALLSGNIDSIRVSGNNAIAANNANTGVYFVSKDKGTTWNTYTNTSLVNRNSNCLSISGNNVVTGLGFNFVVMYGTI